MKSNDKKGLENILQALENFIEPLLEKLKYDKTYRGKVISDKGSGLYSIQINGKEYDIQTESTSLVINSVIKVKAPLNNFSDIYVESAGGGGSGTTDYTLLVNKPRINNVELVGNKSIADLGLQPAGDYVVDADYVHTDNNYTTTEKNKLAGVADNANNYVHPINHPPSIITQDSNNRFVTDAEKSDWSSKTAGTHPLVVASTSLGHVKSGTDISVDASGNVSVVNDSHEHTRLTRIDDRDMKPNVTTNGVLNAVFTTLGGMTGAEDNDYQDMLMINTDSAGVASLNALVLDKSEMKIRHYQAAKSATTWGTPKILAYDDVVTTSVKGLMSSTDKTKLDGIATGAQVNNISDVNATDLTDGGASTLHYHASDRDRANHTGTQLSSTISDFATTVRATVLTGLVTTTNAVITATDTVLSALGKLQKQISDNLATLTAHINNVANPHSTTKSQVGLGNCDNTSDVNKPVATQSVNGIMSSTDKAKLDGITAGANKSMGAMVYLGNNSNTSFTFNHALNSVYVFVQIVEVSTGKIVYPDITIDSGTNVTITFSVAPTSNQYKCIVLAPGAVSLG